MSTGLASRVPNVMDSLTLDGAVPEGDSPSEASRHWRQGCSLMNLGGVSPEAVGSSGPSVNTSSSLLQAGVSTEGDIAGVQNFLLQNGVSADRLQARGYGPNNPIDSNDTRAGRARNRRVELTRLN